ncbi:MAG: hypothetical protein P8M80_01895 [Pirellulaceae bacterium]|nr:hypothetical protein [Pirellulaceae bacterium]
MPSRKPGRPHPSRKTTISKSDSSKSGSSETGNQPAQKEAKGFSDPPKNGLATDPPQANPTLVVVCGALMIGWLICLMVIAILNQWR